LRAVEIKGIARRYKKKKRRGGGKTQKEVRGKETGLGVKGMGPHAH